ncbi:hypothetical protein CSA56_13645 [candidate division KSB3 bacterium]|uniref:Fibronectin type-III domain-containing protein n=1 Tax=candidate division KSB3 bacterium TaxID=2044937 RepID=A0A2G6KC75_9BACT|nr:MAG: hypothetical protein CSA56_13645 [candidate division KSB3 bacterium]
MRRYRFFAALQLIMFFVCLSLPQNAPATGQFSHSAWPKDTGAPVNSSPVLGDLDGDGVLEIIVGSDNHKVYAWKPDGTLMPGWPVTTGDSVRSSPALEDLDGDGHLDVIVGSFDNKLYAWNFNGSLLPGWPVTTGSVIYSSPAVGDIDGDQRPEIVVGSFDNKVYAWNEDGTLTRGWPKPTGLFVYSSPALADIDNDGIAEVIVGTDNNRVFAWNGDGTEVAGWPTATEHVVPSSPAVGDVDNDGTLEIVVGSWDKVFMWNSQGERKPGWPVTAEHQVPSSPALADLTNDGRLEIIVGCKNGKVYAWDVNGQTVPGWPTITDAEISGSAVVGDMNGDGFMEVAIGSKDSKVYVWSADGRLLPGWPQYTGGEISSTPAIADIDGNGSIELVIGSKDNNVYAWNIETSGQRAPTLVWRNFRGNPSHSGRYGDNEGTLYITTRGPSEGTPAIEPEVRPSSSVPQTVRVIRAGPEQTRTLPAPERSGYQVPTPVPELGEGYINDLRITAYDEQSVTLSWTAPLGAYTPHAFYDIRYSPDPITQDNWERATQYADIIHLAPAESQEVHRLKNLRMPSTQSGETLYFSVVILDRVGGLFTPVGQLSNVVSIEPVDTEPPSKILDLKIVELDDSTLELSWTAPGDNGNQGTAAHYDLRFSDVPLNETTWLRAAQVSNVPAPLPAGMQQKIQVTKPSNTGETFWGLKVIDHADNISELSEVAVWGLQDVILPSRIVDLRAERTSADTVVLTWTATGDNQNIGQAAQYDIRYANAPITEADWQFANPVKNPPFPQKAGTPETYTIENAPVTGKIFVGIKSIDHSGNFSALSNVVEAAASDRTPPSTITDLQVEDIGKDWVTVSWTVQDADTAAYVLRYGGNIKVIRSWNEAADVNSLPVPSQPGTKEIATIEGLEENATYYVGLRVLDAQGNSSDTSNILRVKILGRSAPDAITDLVIEELRVEGITLNWTAPQQKLGGQNIKVDGYDIRYSLSELTEDTWQHAARLKSIPAPSAPQILETFTVKDGPKDAAYYLAIKSFDSLGNISGLSNVIRVPQPDKAPPEPVIDLLVEESGQDWIRVSWTATSDNMGQAKSQLIRIAPSLEAIKQWEQAEVVPNTMTPSPVGVKDAFTITGLQSNSSYYIAVKSVDAFGNQSEMSNIIRGKTKDAVAPAAIRDLQHTGTTQDVIVLQWTAPGENGMEGRAKTYDARYSQEPITSENWTRMPTVPFVPAPEQGGTRQTMDVSGLNPNTRYYFSVVAIDSSGNTSPLSNVISVLTGDTVAPGAITTLSAENVDSSSVFLNWLSPGDDALHDASERYEIRYSKTPLTEAEWTQAVKAQDSPRPSPSGTEERFLLSGLQKDTLYYIGVKTFDHGGNTSPLSNVVQVYTSNNFVADLELSEFSAETVTLTWTTPGGVISGGERQYDIRYATASMTEENWEDGVTVTNLSPQELLVKKPQTAEKITLSGLPQYEKMFFAVRVVPGADSHAQLSALSNVVELNRLDIIPPAKVNDLRLRDLGAAVNDMRSLMLSWQAPGDNLADGTASQYELRYGNERPSPENWDSLKPVSTVPEPLLAGTQQQVQLQVPAGEDTLYFALRTFDETLNVSELSNVVQWSPEDTRPPARIVDLKAERLANGDITVSWTAPGDNGNRGTAAFYDIRYSNKEKELSRWDKAIVVPGEPLPEAAGTSQEYVISGLMKDTTYYIAMTTTDDAKHESEISNIAIVEEVPPAQINDVAFVGGTETTVTLSWTAPEDRTAARVVKYDIRYAETLERIQQWKRAKKVSHSLIPRDAGTGETITVERLEPNKRYYFAIKALDHSKEKSEMSNVVTAYTADTIPPQLISDIQGSASEKDSITLTWTVVKDDDHHDIPEFYELRYSLEPISLENWEAVSLATDQLKPTELGAQMTYTVNGLEENTRYYFAIRAIDETGNISSLSNPIALRTEDVTAPQAIADLEAMFPTPNSIMLTWTCPSDTPGESRRSVSDTLILASGLPEEDTLISAYDIRYRKMTLDGKNFNEGDWETAERVLVPPTPLTPGSSEAFVIRNLEPNQSYYFAMKSVDRKGNISAISNAALETTLPTNRALQGITRTIAPDETPGWTLSQGQEIGELQQDASGAITLKKMRDSQGITTVDAITAVYPPKNTSLDLRQGELIFHVNSSSPFTMCTEVRAVESTEPYYLCYTPQKTRPASVTGQSESVEASPAMQPWKRRIENYVFFSLAPELLDGEWHEIRRDLTSDLLDGTGHIYRQASRFSVRGQDVSLREIRMQGAVFNSIADFEDRLPPLENGWKLHFGAGQVQLAQEPFQAGFSRSVSEGKAAGDVVISGINSRAIIGEERVNTFLYALSESDANIVVTYPRTGIAALSDKPVFQAHLKAGMEFKLILKVQTTDQREYYLAYLPEVTFSANRSQGTSGNYIYLPLHMMPEGDGWMLITANLEDDLRKNQLEYASTSWLSFHGQELSIDDVGFSTKELNRLLK